MKIHFKQKRMENLKEISSYNLVIREEIEKQKEIVESLVESNLVYFDISREDFEKGLKQYHLYAFFKEALSSSVVECKIPSGLTQ